MRKLLLGAAILVVLAGGAVLAYVNEIVGGAIERGATRALGVDTRVGLVRLTLLGGDFALSGLAVDNPPGFDADRFLTLDRAAIQADLGTLRSPVVEIPRFELSGIDVALEREGRASNYGAILANLKRFESQDTAAQPAGPERRVIVRHLVIEDVRARVEWSELASDRTGVEVVIPRIELRDVGARDGKGVAPAELSNIVMKTILGSIARYGTALPGAVVAGLESGLGGLGRVTGVVVTGAGESLHDVAADLVGGEVGDAIRGVGGNVAEGVGDALGRAGADGLGKLFGGGEEPAE